MILLDTTVLSELIKIRPNANVAARMNQVPARWLCTTCICVMELRYASLLRDDFVSFWQRIEERLLSRVRVLAVSDREARKAGDILAMLHLKGQAIGIGDVLIAACAIVQDATLVTPNVRHFNQIEGLRVENWFEARAECRKQRA